MKKISIGILTYNHEQFIEECLRSVFDSKYPNLEIIISDDASKDTTVKVIDNFLESISTSHTVIFNKNPKNLGLAGNFNKTFGELATGSFLITLGGDDIIKEDYFEMALTNFENIPELMMLDFNADIIDENGQVTRKAQNLGYDIKFSELKNYLTLDSIPTFAPGRMIRKEIVENFEPISITCPTEDSVLVLRALMSGKVGRLNKNVILYRRHSNNISGWANLRKLSNVSIISQYLKDAIYLYNNDLLSDEQIGKLFRRINFEFDKREILYLQKKTALKRFIFRIKRFLYINYGA